MYSRQMLLACLLLPWAASIGCQPHASTTSRTDAQPVDASEPSSTTADISLAIKSWDEVQAWVAQQHGKIVVVDLWSTYCGPCKHEFPRFVEFHQTHGDTVSCASLSLDFYGGGGKPEDVEPAVREFLSSQNATMQNFISSTPDSDILEAVDSVAVPVTLIYDREGKLHKVFNNDNDEYGPEGFTYESQIELSVAALLK